MTKKNEQKVEEVLENSETLEKITEKKEVVQNETPRMQKLKLNQK